MLNTSKMKTYTEKELIQFGNYLLSDGRKKMVKKNNRNMVHHADIENFIHQNNIAEGRNEK